MGDVSHHQACVLYPQMTPTPTGHLTEFTDPSLDIAFHHFPSYTII